MRSKTGHFMCSLQNRHKRSLFQNLNESELGAVAIRLQACVVPVLASVLLAGFADAGM